MYENKIHLERYFTETASLKEEGMHRTIPRIEGQGKWIKEIGAGPDAPVYLNLSSNDYLGIFEKEELVKEFLARTELPRFSAASSRLLTGNCSAYERLEELLCRTFGKEAALLFNSGYHANVGILPALCGKDSLIIADKLVHASIIDGIRLSGCNFIRFRHNDCGHLESILKKEHEAYKTIFVVTESIFSMGGDEAPLRELAALKAGYPQIMLYVDEAHAFGVCGDSGLGLSQKYGLLEEVDILVATLGKAICSVGAFVVCPRILKEYLVNKMRPLIFSTALPPVNIEWSRFILEKLPGFAPEREHLAGISAWLRKELGSTGSNSHIIPFVTKDAGKAVELSQQLREHNIYALPVRPPTVPRGNAGIRFSLTAAVTRPEMENLVQTIFNLLKT